MWINLVFHILCSHTFVLNYIFSFLRQCWFDWHLVDLPWWEATGGLWLFGISKFLWTLYTGGALWWKYCKNSDSFFSPGLFMCFEGMYCDVRRKVSQVINCPLGYSWKFALHLGKICCYGQQLEFAAIHQALLHFTFEMPLFFLSPPKIIKSFKTLNYIINVWIPQLVFPLQCYNDLRKDDKCLAMSV